MFRIRISILSAALAVLALPGLAMASHHPSHDEAACDGTTVDPQHEVCGQIGVTLAEGASIEDVKTDSAPEATVIQGQPALVPARRPGRRGERVLGAAARERAGRVRELRPARLHQ
jgi:hypothetical protein